MMKFKPENTDLFKAIEIYEREEWKNEEEKEFLLLYLRTYWFLLPDDFLEYHSNDIFEEETLDRFYERIDYGITPLSKILIILNNLKFDNKNDRIHSKYANLFQKYIEEKEITEKDKKLFIRYYLYKFRSINLIKSFILHCKLTEDDYIEFLTLYPSDFICKFYPLLMDSYVDTFQDKSSVERFINLLCRFADMKYIPIYFIISSDYKDFTFSSLNEKLTFTISRISFLQSLSERKNTSHDYIYFIPYDNNIKEIKRLKLYKGNKLNTFWETDSIKRMYDAFINAACYFDSNEEYIYYDIFYYIAYKIFKTYALDHYISMEEKKNKYLILGESTSFLKYVPMPYNGGKIDYSLKSDYKNLIKIFTISMKMIAENSSGEKFISLIEEIKEKIQDLK